MATSMNKHVWTRLCSGFFRQRRGISSSRNLSRTDAKGKGSTININVYPANERSSKFRWLFISLGSGTLLFLGYRIVKTKPPDKEPACASNTQVTLYRKMPLKAMSRAWGKFNELDLPMSLRKPLLGLYVWMFGVNLQEAQDEDLKNYRNLSEFFRRQLKPEARILDMASPMVNELRHKKTNKVAVRPAQTQISLGILPVRADASLSTKRTSPSDGKILHFGKCEQGVVEQVKGVNYALKGFLGPMTWKDKDMVDSSRVTDAQYQDYLDIKPGHSLYHCIIYLAPGDYHRFHSPVDWNITYRRHFPGELLSVNPGIARWIQGLFNMNERVVYTGQWEHGFFSYTAVGATNVGSIKIYCDKDLTTNIGKAYPESVYYDKNMCENNKGVQVSKGEMVGEFNLGSTIVLLFEAPENFAFSVQPEQKVLFGEPIGQFVSR